MSKLTATSFFLCLIILISLILRIHNLDKNPPGFYADEASIGFNAYQILKTGHDEHQKFLPIFFEAFGDYKNSFAIYPTVLTIAIFGPNEFSVRLPQAIFGVLSVLVIYFLARELWNQKVGLLAAFIMATAPWHIHLSRFHIESHNAFILLILTSTLFFIKSLRSPQFLPLASLFFGLSFYTYFATRIFTPLYLAGLAFFARKNLLDLYKNHKSLLLKALLIFLIISIPFIAHITSGRGLARYHQVSPTTNLSSPTTLIKKSINLYLAHLDPQFVFLTGDSDYPGQTILRHSISGMGLLYKWQLPFFIFGLISLFLVKGVTSPQNRIILLLMWLLYPLGSVFSSAQTPYATRSVAGIIPYTLILSLGVYQAFIFLRHSYLKILLALAIFVVFAFYFQRFLNLEKAYMNRAYGYPGFQYGAREIVQYFLKNQDRYDQMIIGEGFDGPEAYINFYSLGQCFKCYTTDSNPNDDKLKLIAVPTDKLTQFQSQYENRLKKTIYYPDGREAFYIYEARAKETH